MEGLVFLTWSITVARMAWHECCSASDCSYESGDLVDGPSICTPPIQYMFANHSNPDYTTGRASLNFRIINQRADFSFALFTGGLENPKLIACSCPISFTNPKAPLYPRLAQGKSWDMMAVTWTSGYDIDEATPFIEWGWKGQYSNLSPAGTLTFSRRSMCGPPASTFGWRDPGFIHTSFLRELWPNTMYNYGMGHRLLNGSIIWSKMYSFKSPPYPGQVSLQRVIIFGDMGKVVGGYLIQNCLAHLLDRSTAATKEMCPSCHVQLDRNILVILYM